MKIALPKLRLSHTNVGDWGSPGKGNSFVFLQFGDGPIPRGCYLYPDGTLHDNCHEDETNHGYYPTREDARRALRRYFAMTKFERPTIDVHKPSPQEDPGSYSIGSFFSGKDGRVFMSTHHGFFGLDGVKADDEDEENLSPLSLLPAGTVITITIPQDRS